VIRHLVTSAVGMSIGLGALWFVYARFGEGRRTLLRFAIAFPVFLAVIAAVSAGSETYESRCPGHPQDMCRYNDSVPAMAIIAGVYVLAALIRAWMLYNER
jgi:hypothetical protein